MGAGKKVALVAGAALLYYLYKKHTAAQQQRATQPNMPATGGMGSGTANVSNRRPQLYRSKNGGVYYRDARGKPVWLTVPNRAMQVPVEELQRYAPDYNRYRGPAPSAPRGYRTETFPEFAPDLMNNNYGTGSGGRTGGGTMAPPGPRGGS